MKIQTNPYRSIQAETVLKDPGEKQPENVGNTVSAVGISKTEPVTKAVKLDQVNKRTNIIKSSEAATPRKPAYDQYIPEKPEDTASFGHYRLAKGENGDIQITFAKPTEETSQAGNADKPVTSEQSASKSENVETLRQARDAAGKQVEGKKDSDKPADSGMETISGKDNRVHGLKTKKKQLERDIKAATDARTASTLKRKLAQIEKALKAATK